MVVSRQKAIESMMALGAEINKQTSSPVRKAIAASKTLGSA